jgi:hypothetical protein
MRIAVIGLLALLGAAGCQTIPPPDPITVEEIVHLSAGGPESPALIDALQSRPLAFPVTYQGLQELERQGVSPEVIDTIVTYTVERRARQIAPSYATYYYDPWWGAYPWPYHFNWGFGYRYYRCR